MVYILQSFQSSGKSRNRTSPVLGLHFSGTSIRTNRGLQQEIIEYVGPQRTFARFWTVFSRAFVRCFSASFFCRFISAFSTALDADNHAFSSRGFHSGFHLKNRWKSQPQLPPSATSRKNACARREAGFLSSSTMRSVHLVVIRSRS